MSDENKSKSDSYPSLPPWISLKPTASKEITWLYTNMPSSKSDPIWINPIIPNCGVNFMEKVYEYDKAKETLEIFCIPEPQSISLKECCERDHHYFPGSSLMVVYPNIKNRADWIRLVLPVNDEGDFEKRFIQGSEKQPKLNIDMMKLHPLTITLERTSGTIELDFYPGVQNFDPEMGNSKIERSIVYHALLKNPDAIWPAEWVKMFRLKPLFLRIVGIKAFQFPSDQGYEVSYQKLQEPFTLISNDGAEHACHQDVLCDRSIHFSEVLLKKTIECKMVVTENSRATNLLLEHIYNPLKQLPRHLSLHELCGVLKLAFDFQLFELIGSSTNRLFGKIDKANMKSLWYLCTKLYPLKYKLQILSKLWETLLLKIRRCILEKKSVMIKDLKFDDRSYFLNLKLFADCGPCKCKLLKELCTDLERTVDGESQADYVIIQLLFKRFQSEVITEYKSLDNEPISPNSSASEVSVPNPAK